MAKRILISALVAGAFLAGCGKGGSQGGIVKEAFGKLADGSPAELYTLTNKQGAKLAVTNYGGIVVRMEGPDRSGKLADVVLGYDTLDGYLKDNSPYFGCIVGRNGNRIGNAKFSLDGKEYLLAKNNLGSNNLHGGLKGFDKQLWKAEEKDSPEGPSVLFSRLSPDGEEGYPGNLKVEALYTWTHDNALRIDYTATTDKPTICNLTHHSYFNLLDAGASDILGHELMIPASHFTPMGPDLITTGEVRAVKGTPFDFTIPTAVGARIAAADEQLKNGKGYDHNWVLDRQSKDGLELAAKVREPKSGRILEVLTTDPATQFYCGNFLDGTITGKNGTVYRQRNGLCLEPQKHPDAINKPKFPSPVLRPGETYKHTIVYRLSAEK